MILVGPFQLGIFDKGPSGLLQGVEASGHSSCPALFQASGVLAGPVLPWLDQAPPALARAPSVLPGLPVHAAQAEGHGSTGGWEGDRHHGMSQAKQMKLHHLTQGKHGNFHEKLETKNWKLKTTVCTSACY